MKFMQRAVASASSNASSDADTPSAKKRKFEHSSPQGRLNVDIDEASIKAALDRQEATRRAALQQHSSTDTEWVVTPTFEKHTATKRTQPRMNIVYVGYGDIDSADDSCDGEDIPSKGRTSTRKPKESEVGCASCVDLKHFQNSNPLQKTLPRKEDSDDGNSDASQDSEEEDSSSSPRSRKRSASMADSRSRSQSRSRPSAESLKAKEFRDKRKKKEIQLNKLTSISSAGGGSPQSSMTCYNCHKTGHRAVDCPKKGPGNHGRNR